MYALIFLQYHILSKLKSSAKSISLVICISVYLSVRRFIHLSVCLSIRPSINLPVFPWVVCLSVRQSIHLPVCLFVRPSACLSVCPSICLLVCLSVNPFACRSVNPFACRSVFPSVCPSACLFFFGNLSVHPPSVCLSERFWRFSRPCNLKSLMGEKKTNV
jgi:hypothetical protein